LRMQVSGRSAYMLCGAFVAFARKHPSRSRRLRRCSSRLGWGKSKGEYTMKTRLLLSALLITFFVPALAFSNPLPTAPPGSRGPSPERLKRITDTLKAQIAKEEIPGAVLLIARRGKIAYFEAMGSLDPEKKTSMSKDAIFRIYSMTKPITTVTA